MGTYYFKNGAGQEIAYDLSFDPDGTPLFRWDDDADRNAISAMYSAGQPDPEGRQNFSNSVAAAIGAEEITLPPSIARTPEIFLSGRARDATSWPQFRRFCAWSENNEPAPTRTVRLGDLTEVRPLTRGGEVARVDSDPQIR